MVNLLNKYKKTKNKNKKNKKKIVFSYQSLMRKFSLYF